MKIPSDSILSVNIEKLRSNSRANELGESQPGRSRPFNDVNTVEHRSDYAPNDVDSGEKILELGDGRSCISASAKLIHSDLAFSGDYSSKIVAMYILEPLGL